MNTVTLLKTILSRRLYLLLRSQYRQRKKTVSQMGQDFWVFGEVFNEMENGFFLEVGSADGIRFSNTFLLEKRYHWRGICVEPNPLLFHDLRHLRNVSCLNVCIDSVEGEVEFAQRDVLGGIVADDTDNTRIQPQMADGPIITLQARPLLSVLLDENAPQTIDYCSIDVEGAEDRILCDFSFDKYTFKCMTIERPKPRLRSILVKNGYIPVKEIPNHDVFYIHESFYHEYERNIFEFWEKQQR